MQTHRGVRAAVSRQACGRLQTPAGAFWGSLRPRSRAQKATRCALRSSAAAGGASSRCRRIVGPPVRSKSDAGDMLARAHAHTHTHMRAHASYIHVHTCTCTCNYSMMQHVPTHSPIHTLRYILRGCYASYRDIHTMQQVRLQLPTQTYFFYRREARIDAMIFLRGTSFECHPLGTAPRSGFGHQAKLWRWRLQTLSPKQGCRSWGRSPRLERSRPTQVDSWAPAHLHTCCVCLLASKAVETASGFCVCSRCWPRGLASQWHLRAWAGSRKSQKL